MPSILPTPSPSSPNPHPSHPHSTHLPFSAHTLSVPSPLSPLRYSSNLFICYPVSSRHQPVPLSTRQPVNLQCYSSNLFICYPVSSCIQLVNSSPHQLVNLPVTHRTCSPVTMSPLAYNLLTRLPVNSSTCPLLSELVHLLPCLLSPPTCSLVHSSTRQLTMLLSKLVHLLPCLLSPLTCSLVHSLIRLLVNYFYHLTFLSVLV